MKEKVITALIAAGALIRHDTLYYKKRLEELKQKRL